MSITDPELTPERKLTAWFALWLVLGYVFAQFIGATLAGLIWGLDLGIRAGFHHQQLAAQLHPDIQVLAWSIMLGMVLGAGWVFAFTWHHARPWWRGATATDVAWRAPTRRDAYAVAAILAFALVALVGMVEHFLPPDPRELVGPMQQLSASHGLPHVLFILVAVVMAPPLEELIFRGAGFAAVARSFGTVTAAIATTLVFVLLHAADKIHYWPGFLLVGCLALTAVLLRLHYRSLWPGILLHACYNGLLILFS